MNLEFFLVILRSIIYIIPIPLLVQTYRKYHHNSHLLLLGAILAFFFGNIPGFLSTESNNILEPVIAWIVIKICFLVGVWQALLALQLAQKDSLQPSSQLVTIIFGITIGLFLNPNNIHYNPDQGSASYSPVITLMGAGINIIFISWAVYPLALKLIRGKITLKKKQYSILLCAWLILILWIVLLFFAEYEIVRTIRAFTLPIAMFLWIISLYLDPLVIGITKSRIQSVLVLTKTGLPLFSYDFRTEEALQSALLAGVLSAIKMSLEEIVSENSSLTSLHFQNSELNFMTGDYVVLAVVSGQGFSSNLKLIAKIFLQKLESEHKISLRKGIVNLAEYDSLNEELKEITDTVIV